MDDMTDVIVKNSWGRKSSMQGSRSKVLIAHFGLALGVQEGKPILLPIQLSLGGDNDVSTS